MLRSSIAVVNFTNRLLHQCVDESECSFLLVRRSPQVSNTRTVPLVQSQVGHARMSFQHKPHKNRIQSRRESCQTFVGTKWLLNRTVSSSLYRRYGFTRIANNPRKSESSGWSPNDQCTNYIASIAYTQVDLPKHPSKTRLRTAIPPQYLASTIHFGSQLAES